MRRLAPSLIAAFGIALLAACSGGGYGFNSGGTTTPQTPTSILFQNGSASVNDFFLIPNGNAPLQVSASAIKGTGSGSVVVPDAIFTWAAAYAPAGTAYLKGASPNGSGTCGAIPAAVGTVTIGGTPTTGNNVVVTVSGTTLTIAQTTGQTTTALATAVANAINGSGALSGQSVSASASATVVTISANPTGGGGNGIALAASSTGGATAAASGSTLSGGSAPLNSLLQQGPGGNPYPGYGGAFTQLLAQPAPPTQSPTYTGQAATIFVGVPFLSAAPFTPQQPSPATTGNYCIRIVATHTVSGVIGSLVVVVSQAP